MSTLRVSNIADSGGTPRILTTNVSPTGYYTGIVNVQSDTTTRTFTSTWAAGAEFTTVSGFKANSLLRIQYYFPMRNDSSSWGGGYVEPQIRLDGGTYMSLGSSGYSAVMDQSSGGTIGFYNQEIIFDPARTTPFTAQMRFYHRAYDGTLTINGNNDVNATSGTATTLPNPNGTQHYTRVIIQELARLT